MCAVGNQLKLDERVSFLVKNMIVYKIKYLIDLCTSIIHFVEAKKYMITIKFYRSITKITFPIKNVYKISKTKQKL